MKIRALIVDDEPLARQRIRLLLAEEPDMEVVGESGDGFEAVDRVQDTRPDLLFLDVQMPILLARLDRDQPRTSPRLDAVANGVLDQRLKEKSRY